jgi:CubicO group peptidase (beta-lactamase class C family)
MVPRFVATVLLAGACLAQNIDSRMDQAVQSYASKQQFMGSVLVARGTDVLFSKGYGSADLEWNIPNVPNTKFRLGSITKQFTAASILLLEERGKLSINDPVKKYMPDAPAAWDKITIFNLLTHTSGIPNFTSFPDYPKLEPISTTAKELVDRFKDKPLEFQPGEKWNYSNSGYVLLGYLIEKITGGSYAKFVADNIFTPLGMKDSGYDSNTAVIPRRASGYVHTANGFENSGFVNMSVPFSAGALYSTSEDLLKWEQGLFGGKILSAASLEKMTTPFKNDYAFGLQVETKAGHKVIDHGGGIEGFNTELDYYPEDKLVIVALANIQQVPQLGAITSELAAIARGEKVVLQTERKEITVDPKILARYVGAYRLGPADFLITLDGNQLNSKLGNQPVVPIFPQSETMFFAKVVDAQIEFAQMDAQGVPGQLILHQNGRDMPANRLSDAEFKQIETESKEIADATAAAMKRVKDQTQDPRTEAALRRDIEELRTGQPKYELMSSGLANVTRQQLPQLQATINQLGAVQSVTFKGVGPGGADIYDVKFEHGSTEWRIMMQSDSKVASVGFRPQ